MPIDGLRFPDDMTEFTAFNDDSKILVSDTTEAKAAKWFKFSSLRTWIAAIFTRKDASNLENTNITSWQNVLKIALLSNSLKDATNKDVYNLTENGYYYTDATTVHLPQTNKTGFLQLLLAGANKQLIYTTVYENKNEIWINQYISSTWSGWSKSTDQNNKGWFANNSLLATAYPTGTDGWYAVVGSTDSIWTWDSDTGHWVDTDKKGQVTSINNLQGAVVLTTDNVTEGSINKYNKQSDWNQTSSTAPDFIKNKPSHNSIEGLQGGSTNDYQHLTTAEKNLLHTQNTDFKITKGVDAITGADILDYYTKINVMVGACPKYNENFIWFENRFPSAIEFNEFDFMMWVQSAGTTLNIQIYNGIGINGPLLWESGNTFFSSTSEVYHRIVMNQKLSFAANQSFTIKITSISVGTTFSCNGIIVSGATFDYYWGGALQDNVNTALDAIFYNRTTNKYIQVTDDNIDVKGNTTFLDNVTISGKLFLNGSTFITNAEFVEIEDNLLLINKGEAGAGVTKGTAGIEVERGTLANYKFLFDESDDLFKIGIDGNLQPVATREASPLNGGFAKWNNTTFRYESVNLLDYIKTIDGTGSEIDADFLDGKHASYFYNTENANLNTINWTANILTTNAVVLDRASGSEKPIFFKTNGANRWKIASSSLSESGSNVGSDFVLVRYLDDGATSYNNIYINRTNGYMSVGGNPQTTPYSSLHIRNISTNEGIVTLTIEDSKNSSEWLPRTVNNRLLFSSGDASGTFERAAIGTYQNETTGARSGIDIFIQPDTSGGLTKLVRFSAYKRFLFNNFSEGTETTEMVRLNGDTSIFDATDLDVTELITNGNFTSTANWTAVNGILTVASNIATLTETDVSVISPYIYQAINTIIGQKYLFTCDFVSQSNMYSIQIAASTSLSGTNNGLNYVDNLTTAHTVKLSFTATSTTTYIRISGTSLSNIQGSFSVQNATCKKVIGGDLAIFGNLGIGQSSDVATAKLDINSDIFRLRTSKTPATASAIGNQGDICWDNTYMYVCVATNTWKRTLLSTW